MYDVRVLSIDLICLWTTSQIKHESRCENESGLGDGQGEGEQEGKTEHKRGHIAWLC